MVSGSRFGDLSTLVGNLRLGELLVASLKGVVFFVVPFVVVIFVLERLAGADVGRYRTRNFVNDVLYGVFYRGGFYGMLVFSAVANVLEAPLAAISFRPLEGAPFYLTAVVFWLGGDFLLYWIHRLQHRNSVLWAFHSVHHSQEQLTTVTQYRRHPVDFLMNDVALFVVFVVVLGISPRTWMPLYIGMATLQALQHAELTWSYGRLYGFVVSPLFHSYHHSVDPRHHHRNFAQMFSVWDYVFGTAVEAGARPTAFGVTGLRMVETFLGTLVAPFVMLAKRAGRRATRETVDSGEPIGVGTPKRPADGS